MNNKENIRDRLTSALKLNTSDFCEIRYEVSDSTGFGYWGREFDRVSTSKSAGGIVRACTRGGWGVAVFDSIDALEKCVREACACAALVGRETTLLADIPPLVLETSAKLTRDFRGVALDEKLRLACAYNDLILGLDPAIESSRVSYGESFRTTSFVNTRGAWFQLDRPRVSLALNATARKNGMTQRAHDSFASTHDFNAVLNHEADAETITRRAIDLLSAPKPEGRRCTVLLDQDLGGVFAHEAFGHLCEADFLYENPKMRELMTLGRRLGGTGLNVTDDGTIPGKLGSSPCDDEATPTGKTRLVTGGLLTGLLHSLETAGRMNMTPTGNARAINGQSTPIVRMTNTFIEPGTRKFEELLKGIDNGIYARGAFGGQTMLEMFTFSAAYGYRIQNGRIGELLRDVVLTGNVFETLDHIDGFGDDLSIRENAGGCGKAGQSPLPVTTGAPHLRVRDVLVGGQNA